VADEYRITQHQEKNFAEQVDIIIAESKFSPTYSASFDSYYEEVSKKKSKNTSVMVSKGDTPIACLLSSMPPVDSLNLELEYFGRPAALISNPNIDLKNLYESILVLSNFIGNNFTNPINDKTRVLSGALRINDSRIINTRFFQKLIGTFNKSETRYTRVIDLSLNLEELIASYSKSVRSVVRINPDELEDIEIIHQYSSQEEIEFAVDSLKELHLKSAGRRTRSQESWEIQREALANGKAFISQFRREGEIVSSAYFMRTKHDSYYGVSASIPKKNGESLSHLCIHHAIKYCKESNLRSFHLGDQLSHLSRSISEKEQSIEKFKSFFGGGIVLEILFSK
jgi:hypothetical protein